MRYWASWVKNWLDSAPRTNPPPAEVLGWWMTGCREADDTAFLCAMVEATSSAEAQAIVDREWPGQNKWRFCVKYTGLWEDTDRFPLLPWMRERMKSFIQEKE